MATSVLTTLYRGVAGLVGVGCVVGVVFLIVTGKAWSWSGGFAIVNLILAAWFLLAYGIRGDKSASRRNQDNAKP
jgi:hypothetical protein